MTNGQPENLTRLQAKLMELRRRYVADMPQRITRIRLLWQGYSEDPTAPNLAELYSEVHKIAGTATIYGLKELGDLAQQAEEHLSCLQQDSERLASEKLSASMERLISWRPESDTG